MGPGRSLCFFGSGAATARRGKASPRACRRRLHSGMKARAGLFYGFGFLLTIGASAEAPEGLPELNHDPDRARIVTEDLDRFWEAWDRAAAAPEQRRDIFQRDYLDRATPGLEAFFELRIGEIDRLLRAIDGAPRYYASVREQMDQVAAVEAPLRRAFHRFQELLPGAVFPDVYLVIGAMTSGGTIHLPGILIGFEMNARGPDSPMDELSDWHRRVVRLVEDLPVLIIHELVHIQQAVVGRLDFEDLLGQSIVEGAADFITERVMGDHGMGHVHEWALPREAELWAEFREVMHGTDTTGWLYGGTQEKDRPADLGYFIGYRIVEAFYRRAEDKTAALQAIVRMDDPADFLARSGYGTEKPH
ncbi:MAG: hypothetical protein EA425_01390 [Puniceicoccaceae bacterium]|nr:MAG: hypothetical protein EA425_01390 [Puniceicoccaceae bacterium]